MRLDEHGDTSVQTRDLDDLQDNSIGETVIVLRGEPFMEVWDNRSQYFISPDEIPVHESKHADAYAHRCGGRSVFYRGIRVHRLDRSRPFIVTTSRNESS